MYRGYMYPTGIPVYDYTCVKPGHLGKQSTLRNSILNANSAGLNITGGQKQK